MRRPLLRFSLLLIVGSLCYAQNRPQLTWQGVVKGGATLFIQGTNVDVQGRETGSVDQPVFSFLSPLPAAPGRVEMKVRRGGGKVRIAEQPAAPNDFSAVVEIRPGSAKGEKYVLDFFWSPVRKNQVPRAREL